MTEPSNDFDETPGAFLRITFVDRLVRFVMGAILASIGMLALLPFFDFTPDLFGTATGIVAFMAGLATAIWGDRFLLPLLRAMGRTR